MNTNKIIYLDYMATTPVASEVVDAMLPYLKDQFGNASSNNQYGYTAKEAINTARNQVATTCGAKPEEIIFTSGATEATNMALKGVAEFYKKSGNHIITLTTEHAATLATCKYLELHGYEVSYLEPEKNGLLNLNKLRAALKPTTILVSICHVNNEIGVIQDINKIGEIVSENGALLHIDAAQSIGKTELNLSESKVSLASLSAHKCYGPKGVGALYVSKNPRIHISPLNHGGGQEKKLRSGTVPTHQVVGMGVAYEIAQVNFKNNLEIVKKLQRILISGLSKIPDIIINGDLEMRVPHNLNITFNNLPGDLLYSCLQSKLALSSGSACNSHQIKVSHVLTSLGLTFDQANATIRFSYSHQTSEEDLNIAISLTKDTVENLRKNI
jgi:cysteine desulfurase